MKAYYLIGAGIGLVLGIIIFIISGISGCVQKNQAKREISSYRDWCNVRYYMDDTEDSVVKYKIVDDGTYLDFSLDSLPRKEGYIFAGFYDDRDFNFGTQYVDDQGEGLLQITEDIILYPIFTPLGG